MENQTLPTSPTTRSPASFIAPAGFWRRFAAVLIDLQVVSFIALPVNLIFAVMANVSIFRGGGPLGSENWKVLVIQQLAQLAVLMAVKIAYATYLIPRRGGTLGKLVMGVRVLDKSTGMHLTWKTALLRETVGKFTSLFFTGFLGYVLAAFRSDKRALHDFICNTRVLYFRVDE